MHQNFRNAMAAPAALPEFRGTVTAVLTERYWDMEFVRLRDRERTIKSELEKIAGSVKAGEMTRDAGRAAMDMLYAADFSEREMEILKQSVSNADFHYLGSAGIMAQIGRAFAEALMKLERE